MIGKCVALSKVDLQAQKSVTREPVFTSSPLTVILMCRVVSFKVLPQTGQ